MDNFFIDEEEYYKIHVFSPESPNPLIFIQPNPIPSEQIGYNPLWNNSSNVGDDRIEFYPNPIYTHPLFGVL